MFVLAFYSLFLFFYFLNQLSSINTYNEHCRGINYCCCWLAIFIPFRWFPYFFLLFLTQGQKEFGACCARATTWWDFDGNKMVEVTVATLCFRHCSLMRIIWFWPNYKISWKIIKKKSQNANFWKIIKKKSQNTN